MKNTLTDHKRKYNKNEIFSCDLCEVNFRSKHTLSNHKRRTHVKKTDKNCRFCKQILSTIDSFKRHMKNIHFSTSPSKSYLKHGEGFISKDINEDDIDNDLLECSDDKVDNDEYQKHFVNFVNSIYICDICKKKL